MKQQERRDEREAQPRVFRRNRHGNTPRRQRHELQQPEREERKAGEEQRPARQRRVSEIAGPAEAVVLGTRIHDQPAARGMQRHAATADAAAQGRDRDRSSECQDRCEGAARPQRSERERVNGAEGERRPRDRDPDRELQARRSADGVAVPSAGRRERTRWPAAHRSRRAAV